MLYNVDDTVEFLRLNNIEYWVVQLKDTDNSRVFESDDTKSFEDNVSLFRRVMDISKGSRYIIKGSYKKEDKRGKFSEEFRNLSNEPAANVSGIPQQMDQASIEGIVNKRVEERFAAMKAQEELETLRKERDEYKREAERRAGIPEKLMENLTPYVGTLAQFFISKLMPGGAPIAMAGIEQNNVQPSNNESEMEEKEIILTDEQSERLENALQKWGNADPEFLEYIEAFALFASSGKKVMNMDYNMVKGMFGPAQLRNLMQ